MPRDTSLPRKLRAELVRAVGPTGLITEPGRLLVYESDALTTARGSALAVVLPPNRDALLHAIRALHRAAVPFVPRGAGTGLAGGAVARDAVILCTARMSRILAVDPTARLAVVEPGVITADISTAAAPHGLRYLPDPASATACTIGGNVAMNSGGPHCLRHGVTSDHVMALEVVLPDGRAVRLGRGEEGGLDLVGLFTGSEGTLGVASRIQVRLAPMAADVGTLLAVFDDVRAAGQAVSDILALGVLPVALEIIDHETIGVVEASAYAAGLPTDASAALVVESEGETEEVESDLGAVADILRRAGARQVHRARDETERTSVWQARKKAYGALGRLAPDVLVQDAVVPRTTLADLLPAIQEVARHHGLRLASFFHAGDGNLHPNLLFDRRDPDQVARVEAASREIMRLCVATGGTITGEHGVGLDKVVYMPMVFGPEELAVQARIKAVIDPEGRCNPDKLLPPRPPSESQAPPANSGSAAGSGGATTEWLVPRNSEEIMAWLRSLSKGDTPLVTGRSPRGTEVSELAREAPLIGTENLASLIEYRPRDLTITVGAGMRIERLQEIVAEEGQWLPVEGPGEKMSLGGLAATAAPGAFDAAFGPVRRQLLACRMVSPTGRDLRWGRPVVKNVAGYDLVRLVAGSRARTGVLTEITLRLWPRPAVRRDFRLSGGDDDAHLAARLAGPGGPEPDAARWTWTREDGSELTATVVGSEAAVDARSRRLMTWAAAEGVELTERDGTAMVSTRLRSLADAAFRMHAGRDYVCAVATGLMPVLDEELVRLVVYPLGGAGWIELKRPAPAHRREAPDWLGSAVLSDEEIRIAVERGGEAEHTAVERRRHEGEVDLERRLERHLSLWNRNWLADYL